MPPGGNRYTKADEQAQVVVPPVIGNNAQIAFGTSPVIIKVPDAWLNRWVNLCAMSADAYITTGPTLAELQALNNFFTDSVINGTTKAVSLSNNTPFPCPLNAIVPFYFDSVSHAYLLVVGLEAGKLYGTPSSPNPGGV